MKKLMTIFGAVLLASTFLTSCGSDETQETNSVKLKPKSTSIKGELGDYFEVVDREYEIKQEEGEMFTLITVEVKRNNKDFSFPVDNINPFGTSGGEDYHVGFGIELIGESGPIQVVPATADGMSGPYDSEDITGLMKLKKGETGYIRWSVDKLDGLKSFQLSSALQKEEHATSSESSGSDASGDCDQFCSDYEQFADDYIAFMKEYKANPSDMTILTEYSEMMSKMAEMEESSKDCTADAKAGARISKAILKISKALM